MVMISFLPSSKFFILIPRNITITGIFMTGVTTLALIIPDITKVFALIGGFTGVIYSRIVPTYLYIKTSRKSIWAFENIGSLVLCVVLATICYMSVILVLFSEFLPVEWKSIG